jgi:hypothetical protein
VWLFGHQDNNYQDNNIVCYYKTILRHVLAQTWKRHIFLLGNLRCFFFLLFDIFLEIGHSNDLMTNKYPKTEFVVRIVCIWNTPEGL